MQCTISFTADPGVGKVLWVMNDSKSWSMGGGRDGVEFDASAAKMDCDPIAKADGT